MDMMFFVRQQSNQCGLHAIQNLFKSALITAEDLHTSCEDINKETGDAITNHESFGGDWSVSAVIKAITVQGYSVTRSVNTKRQRDWCVDSIDTLMKRDDFRGFIIHQPQSRHFTCLRPEEVGGERHLYYVDSQARGPIRISPKLAVRRCLEPAYAWEPFLISGPEMNYVGPQNSPEPVSIYEGAVSEEQEKFQPSAGFLRDWEELSKTMSSKTI